MLPRGKTVYWAPYSTSRGTSASTIDLYKFCGLEVIEYELLYKMCTLHFVLKWRNSRTSSIGGHSGTGVSLGIRRVCILAFVAEGCFRVQCGLFHRTVDSPQIDYGSGATFVPQYEKRHAATYP